jgi:hypothetical protein
MKDRDKTHRITIVILIRSSLLFAAVDLAMSPDISANVLWGDGEGSSTDFSSLSADVSLQYFGF